MDFVSMFKQYGDFLFDTISFSSLPAPIRVFHVIVSLLFYIGLAGLGSLFTVHMFKRKGDISCKK